MSLLRRPNDTELSPPSSPRHQVSLANTKNSTSVRPVGVNNVSMKSKILPNNSQYDSNIESLIEKMKSGLEVQIVSFWLIFLWHFTKGEVCRKMSTTLRDWGFRFRLQNSPYFSVFKYARAVEQKVWNEAENREACDARALRARKTLTPRFTDFFTDFVKKKPTVLQSSLDWVPSLALMFVRAKRRENINRFKYFPEAVIFDRNKGGIEIWKCWVLRWVVDGTIQKKLRNEEGNKQHLWEIILNRNEDLTVAVLMEI